jgi:hypothetical protein
MSETVVVLVLAAAFVVAGFVTFYKGSKPDGRCARCRRPLDPLKPTGMLEDETVVCVPCYFKSLGMPYDDR